MHRNQKGMSLVEIMVAIAVSAIVIGAAYGSYSVINKNYEFQKDVKYMSQTARAVVKMIARDVRMAGYTDFSATQISEAVKITDSSGACCDRIDIIYDKSSSERIKISYYTQQYNNRYRLMKKTDKCTNSDCSSTSALQSAQPIADYVEDLQFNGMKNGKVASTGAVEYGMGNKRWFYPTSVKAMNYSHFKASNCASHLGDIHKAFDGNPNTVWSCPSSKVALRLIFKDFVRIEKIKLHTAAHFDGGTYGPRKSGSNLNYFSNPQYAGHTKDNVTYPYGKNHNLSGDFSFYHMANGDAQGGINKNVHKCLHKDPAQNKWDMPGNKGCAHGNSVLHNTYFTAKEVIYNTITSKAEVCDGACSGPNIDRGFGYVATKEILLVSYQAHRCTGFMKNPPLSYCKFGYTPRSDHLTEIPDIGFYGEAYGEATIPSEVEIGLLLRSPSEHISKNTSFSINLGNRAFTSNDKYLRDNYSTSVIVRNLYYASQ